jgi:hypothetical protein
LSLDRNQAYSIAAMATELAAVIDAWREAVADAYAAQELLDQTWYDYLGQRGPAATEALVKEVALFRGRAEARLLSALALLHSAGNTERSDASQPTHQRAAVSAS